MVKPISQSLLKKLDDNKDLIIELYQRKNYTSEQIGNKLGFSKSTIDNYRVLNNIYKLYDDKEWLEQKLLVEKMSFNKISQLCSCSSSTIGRAAERLGLYERIEKRKLVIKEDYFSEYNSKSCYWAGFINADAHLASEKRVDTKGLNKFLSINLSSKDIEHLRKFNKELTRENLIREYKTKEYNMCNFKISRHKLCNDLNNNFDIEYNNKSLKEVISDKIPQQYLKDFMRGYFDGDGSISISQNTVYISVVGGKELCTKFKEILDNEYNKDIGKVVQDYRNEDMYYYRIVNKKEAVLLYLFLYDKHSVCLERKRVKFQEILHKI